MATQYGNAAKRYTQMKAEREPFLARARDAASLTIPAMFRAEGADGSTTTPLGWQSFGAYAVNNLSAKVKLSLFPSGIPFFLLQPAKEVLRDIATLPPTEAGELRGEISKGLALVGKEFVTEAEVDGDGPVLYDLFRHLLIGGNHGLHFYPNGKTRGIPLQRYVVLRDAAGNLLEFCIQDELDWETVDADVQAMAIENGYKKPDSGVGQNGADRAPTVTVYTHGYLTNGRFHVYQEVQGGVVSGSAKDYTEEALPYRFFRWIGLEAENYGRSYVEDYVADLQSLDGYEQMTQEGIAAGALFIRFVRPGGFTNKKAVTEAVNGSVLSGDAADVTTLQSQKNADFQTASAKQQQIEARLSRAFLLNSAVQRAGERVTAEEIRFVAKELEDQLGGAYSNQVVEVQTPYARIKMAALMRSGRITRLPRNQVKTVIITGAAALGRMAEIGALDQLISGAVQVLGPQFVMAAVNPTGYMARRAAALNVDTEGVIFTDDEIDAKMQAQQQAALAQSVAPEAVRQVGNMAQTAVQQPQEVQA